MTRSTRLLALAALAMGLTACQKQEAPPPPPPPAAEAPTLEAPAPAPAPAAISVDSITLGSALNADKRVQQATDTFATTDTIYAVVETKGTGQATLKAKWTYHKADQTAVVNESTQTIDATAPAASEFHISKPDGWPAGDYQVEVFLGDASAGTKKFTVK
jgi:hypothetical protein